MREDQHVTMTLAIADNPSDLQVIAVDGRDRLNAPFSFDIDLVSANPALDCAVLLQCEAYLQFGTSSDAVQSVHGHIDLAQRLYRGQHLSLYRLRLMPALQRLSGAARRRTFNGLTVPQMLMRLLQDHGLPDDAYRFVHLIGDYPPREHCVQYDESDLHLLRRLCEEEGISFRYEHSPHRHVLVFSDDPAGFPEWPMSMTVDHLAERLSMRSCYSSHAGELYMPQMSAPPSARCDADNQPLWARTPAAMTTAPRQQVRARQLQRVRCERREIMGRSDQPWLRSGLVTRVAGHPDALFNDQWLVTDVSHSAWQLAPLRGCPSNEVIQILQAMACTGCPDVGIAALLKPQTGTDKPRLASYENSFQVIPWTMPFRPAVEHPKPTFAGVEFATQVDDQTDPSGRVKIRYDWQTDAAATGAEDSWARVAGSLGEHLAGTRLQVRFLEGDPDQPLVCGVFDDVDPGTRRYRALNNDRRAPVDAGAIAQSEGDEQVRIDSRTPLTLRGAHGTLRITENEVRYTPRAARDDAC